MQGKDHLMRLPATGGKQLVLLFQGLSLLHVQLVTLEAFPLHQRKQSKTWLANPSQVCETEDLQEIMSNGHFRQSQDCTSWTMILYWEERAHFISFPPKGDACENFWRELQWNHRKIYILDAMGTPHSDTCVGVCSTDRQLSWPRPTFLLWTPRLPTFLFLHWLLSAQLAFAYNIDSLAELPLRSNINLYHSVQSKKKMLPGEMLKTRHPVHLEHGAQHMKFQRTHTGNQCFQYFVFSIKY